MSGRHGESFQRQDLAKTHIAQTSLSNNHFTLSDFDFDSTLLDETIGSAAQFLIDQQAEDGHWCAELQGDSILESEYILLLAYLGEGRSEKAMKAARYLLKIQNEDGGWSMFPGGKTEVSATVKGYLALKITGHAPDSEPMQKALLAARAAGGVEAVNSFTRYYLALLGLIPYSKCPAVPPELILLPKWSPINIYEMSSWSRTIVVPLSLLWSFQPKTVLPDNCSIEELFLNDPAELSLKSRSMDIVQTHNGETWVPWKAIFRSIDRGIKFFERLKLKPLRHWANKKCQQWILERFANSDGLGAIFPPIVWSIIGLKCLGFSMNSPEIQEAMKQLDDLIIDDGETIRLQPCKSPVWDTAIVTIALREAGVAASSKSIRKAVRWLLSKEVRQKGDWSTKRPEIEPGGWFFEYNNAFYPDIDDTIMVLMALASSMPGEPGSDWTIEMLNNARAKNPGRRDVSPSQTIITGRGSNSIRVLQDFNDSETMLAAMRRGLQWVLGMQCKDGGWAAFDVDNTRDLLTHVPFADHNAMIDPATADITARVLEMMGRLGVDRNHVSIQRGLDFVFKDQCSDGSWFGRWGVNYIYGTWQVLVGLQTIGVSPQDPRMQNGVRWLLLHQNTDGGWGETAASYDDPSLKGQGPSTASQTSWALMGLMAAGMHAHPAVTKGIDYLRTTQTADGTWNETEFTGTGFPRVFYLRYHYYRHSFPLMALSRYRTLAMQPALSKAG
ncbi:terpene cyclase/mutase family protein [Lacunimicrobium album]